VPALCRHTAHTQLSPCLPRLHTWRLTWCRGRGGLLRFLCGGRLRGRVRRAVGARCSLLTPAPPSDTQAGFERCVLCVCVCVLVRCNVCVVVDRQTTTRPTNRPSQQPVMRPAPTDTHASRSSSRRRSISAWRFWKGVICRQRRKQGAHQACRAWGCRALDTRLEGPRSAGRPWRGTSRRKARGRMVHTRAQLPVAVDESLHNELPVWRQHATHLLL
jgi:hypothetical protein